MASSKRLSREDYHVAWICPVADVELLPARLMLDEEHPAPPYDTHFDDYTYICGSISGHKVVVATCTQGETGNVNAGRLASSLFKTFPNIRMAVLVGIGGAIPRSEVSDDPLENIHLGDVVVGWPGDGKPACVHYDRGRSKVDGHFELVGTIGNPDRRLTNALAVLVSDIEMGRTSFDDQLGRLQGFAKKKKFEHPGFEHDRLFKATYHHVGDYGSKCVGCDPTELVKRPQRTENDKDTLIFHQGRIATGTAVIQDGELRDEIGARCGGALCVEMEAAGVDTNRQCLVIRGISDYADSHKSDLWRSYAAGRAAAFTRALLGRVQPAEMLESQTVLGARVSSIVQTDCIHRPLLAPQDQASGLSERSNNPQYARPDRAMQGPSIVQKVESHSSLKMSVKTFQKLDGKEGIEVGGRAGRLLSTLANVLKSGVIKQNHIPSVHINGRVQSLDGFDDISPQELKRLRNIIKSSQSICVNQGSPRFESSGHGRLIQKRSMKVVNIQGHEIRITLFERDSLPFPRYQSWRATREKKTETIAKIRITETSVESVVLTAYLHFQHSHNRLEVLNPVISIGKTLPLDSPVFDIVREGDVDSLKRLLEERQCSLRDRDIYGTPLLFYAMYQPEMCKFLLENGADFDERAADCIVPEFEFIPLTLHVIDCICDEEKDEIQNAREFRRLLLEAGADPTLMNGTGYTLVHLVMEESILDSLREVLDIGKPFIDLNERDLNGNTPLLLHCNEGKGHSYADIFTELLDRGADIHGRDLSGRTCLHLATRTAGFFGVRDIRDDARALILLIERGSNIFTWDYNGRSIFDDAYECNHEDRPPLGSLRGDLWDHVLIRSGHREHMRPPEERIYHYTRRYTEEHSRLLWEGWEHLLPYSDETSTSCPVLTRWDEDDDSRRRERRL
ncbi:hypothetical protein BU24DRAFT_465291 [Aaosphaeria arxii CBS 175.79]|uniref:Uncharacterized protein n=1 Tax=Aaosphaeria arxii CBS 175.79 TaxID=1450172 RepID=A0A6A5XJ15_9PLEO|nr:uncharacterized protein BU24DRAFT_465291 [Aaosphaeria arxii CBS 175.79]KAF2012943.1 hypothetical protein BU24DRAFT_465291 [Aaosphaeria arxii CBS 175.79]